MPDPGRTTDSRTVPSVTTTVGVAFSAPAGSFDPVGDVGRTIAGGSIPAGATIATVNAAGSAGTLDAGHPATAAATVTVTLGAGNPAVMGFRGYSPETPAESGVLTVASRNAGVTDHNRPSSGRLNLQRSRY